MKCFPIFLRRGFTLIELLLGVSIFSIISLTLYSVFFAAMKVQKQSISHEDLVYQMSLGLETIGRDLENAVGYNFANSYPKLKAFDGAQDRVTFILASPEGLQFVSYYIEKADRGERHQIKIGAHSSKNVAVTQKVTQAEETYHLIRSIQPFVDYVNAAQERIETRIICRGVKSDGLKFSFGAMNPDSHERSWQPAWSFNVIPALVKITLQAHSGGQTIELLKEVLNPAGTMIVQ